MVLGLVFGFCFGLGLCFCGLCLGVCCFALALEGGCCDCWGWLGSVVVDACIVVGG